MKKNIKVGDYIPDSQNPVIAILAVNPPPIVVPKREIYIQAKFAIIQDNTNICRATATLYSMIKAAYDEGSFDNSWKIINLETGQLINHNHPYKDGD